MKDGKKFLTTKRISHDEFIIEFHIVCGPKDIAKTFVITI